MTGGERLQKYMAVCKVASRRKCEEIIKAGRVSVNDEIITEMGVRINSGDIVKLDGSVIIPDVKKIYIILNKPANCLSSVSDPRGRPTVLDVVGDTGARIYPVGRLDWETEGFILLTNDGDLSNKITHPSHEIKKVYYCVIEGALTVEDVNKLRNGIDIGGYITRGAGVELLSTGEGVTRINLTISEGKNRQIRRMFAGIGRDVIYLRREAVGPLSIDGINKGKWRYLNDIEIDILKKAVN